MSALRAGNALPMPSYRGQTAGRKGVHLDDPFISDRMRSRAPTHDADELAARLEQSKAEVVAAAAEENSLSLDGAGVSSLLLSRVLGKISEFDASPNATTLLAAASRAVDAETCAVKPLAPSSSNTCTAFVLVTEGTIVASSNSCYDFVIVDKAGAVIASSNGCRAFVALGSHGAIRGSSNSCTAFVVNCDFAACDGPTAVVLKTNLTASSPMHAELKLTVLPTARIAEHCAPCEHPYSPLPRFKAMSSMLKAPRGSKTLEHERALRASCPSLGSLAPRRDRPSPCELTYDPVVRYALLAKVNKAPRGSKTLEHERALRASCPSLGSLAPRRDRPSPCELTYDPVVRYALLAKVNKAPRGSKTLEHERALRASCPSLGSLAPRRDRPSPCELTYDPVVRYALLAKVNKAPRGSKTLEHERALRASCPSLGSLAPRRDRPSPCELTYDPVVRYALLAKVNKAPRGSKTLEHERALRASCPSLGSLAPRRDRPSPCELTYDPVVRNALLAKANKAPRGSKTLEHERALRASCPSLGSLAPRRDRPSPCELTYDPVVRYALLAKVNKAPRGSKTLEHERALRASRPRCMLNALMSASKSSSIRCVSFDDDAAVIELDAIRPKPVKLPHRHARTSAKKLKSPKLSPALSPKAKSKPLSPRVVSPGFRHVIAALLTDALELPPSLVKSDKRAELEHLRARATIPSRCSRFTLAAPRAPRLFYGRGSRGIC